MKESRKALSLQDRQNIWMMRAEELEIREIGRRINRCASVVSRELKRNCALIFISARLTPLERANSAHEKATKRCKEKRRGKRKARPAMSVYEHVASKLIEKDSPERIAQEWGKTFFGQTLSVSTIYRMIKKDWPELKKHLPEHGKPRRAQVMGRRGKVQQAAAEKRHISERSEEANTRAELGHLEVDSILSKRGSKAAIVSIIDRKSRRRWYISVRNLEAETVRKALVALLHTLKPWQRKSITTDRGSEFAEWPMLEKIFPDLKVYFCTAYSPHEKGSVERSNRDFRAFFPKGTDFALVDIWQIQFVENKINSRSMKLFNWKSPNQIEQEEQIPQALYQNAA